MGLQVEAGLEVMYIMLMMRGHLESLEVGLGLMDGQRGLIGGMPG